MFKVVTYFEAGNLAVTLVEADTEQKAKFLAEVQLVLDGYYSEDIVEQKVYDLAKTNSYGLYD